MMSRIFLFVLQAPDSIKALRGQFHAKEAQPPAMTGRQFGGLLLVAVGVLVLVLLVMAWFREDRRRQGPAMRHMCKDLGVGRTQQRLLMTLARSQGFDSPVSLLISRGTFDFAMHRYVRRHEDARSQLVKLREMIFGQSH